MRESGTFTVGKSVYVFVLSSLEFSRGLTSERRNPILDIQGRGLSWKFVLVFLRGSRNLFGNESFEHIALSNSSSVLSFKWPDPTCRSEVPIAVEVEVLDSKSTPSASSLTTRLEVYSDTQVGR